MRIALKFMLAFVVCGIVALAAHTALLAGHALDRLEASASAHHVFTGVALRPALLEVWQSEGEERALALLATAERELGPMRVRWVRLGDTSGRHAPVLDVGALEGVRRGEDVVWVDHGAAGGRRVHTYVPMALPGADDGALEFVETMTDEAAVVRSAIADELLVTASAVVVVSLVALGFGAMFVGRPMRRLLEQARRIGAGDLSSRIHATGRDEFVTLSVAFDRMADEIEASRAAERHEADEKLRALLRLRHAHRLTTVGNIASGMAHELGTPLNLIRLRTEMLRKGEVPEDEVPEYLERIEAHVDRMTRIVRALLDFASPKPPEKANVDMNALTVSATSMLAPLARKAGITLDVRTTSAPIEVHADALLLEQVIANLVVNAIQACASGDRIDVHTGTTTRAVPGDPEQRPRPCAVVVVKDDGPGIAAGDMPRLYELFFTTKAPGEGTGLGLPVARGILEDHGGWLEVESREGEGSAFSVYLPLES